MAEMRIFSPAFSPGAAIPGKYTCDGSDVNPPLAFSGVPAAAKGLALVVDDPDAPAGVWDHWIVWNISPGTGAIGENSLPPGASQGRNGWGKSAYGGPCPPSGRHRYLFRLYALDAPLKLPPGSGKRELERAMQGHILARAELIGTYRRK